MTWLYVCVCLKICKVTVNILRHQGSMECSFWMIKRVEWMSPPQTGHTMRCSKYLTEKICDPQRGCRSVTRMNNSRRKINTLSGFAFTGTKWSIFIILLNYYIWKYVWCQGPCHACCLVMSDSFAAPWTRLLCTWNFPGKNTGTGCHILIQGIFWTQGSSLCLLRLLHWQANSLPLPPKRILYPMPNTKGTYI